MDLINDFKEYLNQGSLIIKKDRLLLGVSGGPDSLTMLDLVDRIRKEFNLHIIVFHLNHQFREKACEEAEFVRSFCQKRNIKVIVKEYDVPGFKAKKKFSFEEAARKIRLNLMIKEANKNDIKKIVLGHNKDDLVETMLLNLFRGSALKGLTGINPISSYKEVKLIHPLLNISRKRIEKYCNFRNLNPRRDLSNEETKFSRNKIRLRVIPYVEKEINPALKDKLAQTASILREEENFLQKKAKELGDKALIDKQKDKIILSVKLLQKESAVLLRRVLREFIYYLKEEPVDVYYYHYQAMEKLIFASETNKQIDLTGNIILKKIYDRLILQKGKSEDNYTKYKMILNIPGEIKLPESGIIKAELISKNDNWKSYFKKQSICLCDANTIEFPLTIRNRKKGDRFQPLGMEGTKKVKDYFIDQKIVPRKRDKIPVITDNQGRIIWLAGLRMDEKFKIRDNTDKILKISYIK
ncbi:MAG: tRNA lysidine(34) synthetase TilS [Bacillota bacterium]